MILRPGFSCYDDGVIFLRAEPVPRRFMNLNLLLSKMGLSASLAQDATLLIVILLASFAFGALIGRSKLLTVLMNVYVSFAILSAVPQSFIPDWTYGVVIFLILVIGMTIFADKLLEVPFHVSATGFMWRIFLLSFLEIALVLGIVIRMMPKKEALGYVSATSYGYLASPNTFLVWMIAPLVFVMLISNRISRR